MQRIVSPADPDFQPLPSLSREARRARKNWNHYFRFLNGIEIMRRYVHPMWNHDVLHSLMQTGSFEDIQQAGI